MNLIKVTLLSILCFTIQLYIAYLTDGNVVYRYIPSNLLYFFVSYFIFTNLNSKKSKIISLCILIFPTIFILIIGFNAYFLENTIKTIPFAITLNLSILIAFLFDKFNYKKIYKVIYVIVMLFSSYIHASYFYGKSYNITSNNSFMELKITTSNNAPFSIEEKKGKVIVLDLWSSSCGICFEKFPNFEKKAKTYEKDSIVEFYALNLPLERDSVINIENMLIDYSFKKLYTKDINSWENLNISSVPRTLVIDKNGNIRYNGVLNQNKYLFYNNIDRIINKLKYE